ncbi:hypothetical protein MRX96_035379 [Rhipicephalus microplus]
MACTDIGVKYRGANWTLRVQFVRRLVEFKHFVRVDDRIYMCSVCDSSLTSWPSYHSCLAKATLAPLSEAPRRRCGVCDVGAWPRETSSVPRRPGWAFWRHSCARACMVCAPRQRSVHFILVLELPAARSVPGFATSHRPRAFCWRKLSATLVVSSRRVGAFSPASIEEPGCIRVFVFQRFVNVRGLGLRPRFSGIIPCRLPSR